MDNANTPTLEADDPRWTTVRSAALRPAMRLDSAYLANKKHGAIYTEFRQKFADFLAEGVARGERDLYEAALNGATDRGVARVNGGQAHLAAANLILEDAHDQVSWAMGVENQKPRVSNFMR